MNLSDLINKIYNEEDIGSGIATTAAGFLGLISYLLWNDVVISFFVAIMAFPSIKVILAGFSRKWIFAHKRSERLIEIKDIFDDLGSEEMKVIKAFIWHGGGTVTFEDCNNSPFFSSIGIDSLVNRGLTTLTTNADGMREAFCVDEELFRYAKSVITELPLD